jgi:flagellar L-ring protein precursor FlgH
VKTNNQMDGRGRTEREGRVLAQITVAIKEIASSGDLVIAGDQLLELTARSQHIHVEGRVRPQDVSDANVVLSTRIANAKISYAGQGDLADVQHPAWWQRFLTLFGL